MGTLNEDLTSIKTVEDTLTSNKVANFAYTDTAYENNNANGVVEYDVSQDQNIPVSTPSVLKVNETILAKGWRAKASSITRMLMNHFLGRLSYNLNKVNDNMSSLLSTLQSHLGTANGLATLDSTGRIPYSQLPESAIEYKGQWDASTNTPTLADGTGTSGDFYIVSVGGTQDLGSGNIQFFENDRVIYDGSVWSRLAAGDVKTVNNISPVNGNITLTQSEVGLSNVVNTGDSDTPVSGGTTKFTTGGAYTELNKKQDKITDNFQLIEQPSDYDFVGGFDTSQGNINPTSFISWTFTQVWNWVKVRLGVRSAGSNTDTDVGSSTKPVFINRKGEAVALDNNSALVNLASTSSANMYASAPRPGVTGTLPVANGGTGQTSLANVSVGSASKLTTARTTYVTLGTASTTTTRDWSGTTTIPVSGTLPITNGGTGATTASGARTNLGLGSVATESLANVLSGANASGVCTTASSITAKAVSITNFALYEGVTVRVMFTNGNSVVTPTLSVNGTGAKEIKVVDEGTIKSLSNSNSSTTVNALKKVASAVGSTITYNDRMWSSYTTLELMYYNNAWVIVGKPIVIEGSLLIVTANVTTVTYYYRVYANGYIEQWGEGNYTSITSSNRIIKVDLPVRFTYTPSVVFSPCFSAVDSTSWYPDITARSTSSFTVNTRNISSSSTPICWIAKGY